MNNQNPLFPSSEALEAGIIVLQCGRIAIAGINLHLTSDQSREVVDFHLPAHNDEVWVGEYSICRNCATLTLRSANRMLMAPVNC